MEDFTHRKLSVELVAVQNPKSDRTKSIACMWWPRGAIQLSILISSPNLTISNSEVAFFQTRSVPKNCIFPNSILSKVVSF